MGKKVLLADDSATIQKLVEMALSDAEEGEYELLAVSDGKQAIDQLDAFQPDIVLADAIMPIMDGYQVSAYIKKDPRYQQLPVVLLTGRFQPYDEDRARQAQIDDRMIKPFSQDKLLSVIDGFIAARVGRAAPGTTAAAVAEPPGEAGETSRAALPDMDMSDPEWQPLAEEAASPVWKDTPSEILGGPEINGEESATEETAGTGPSRHLAGLDLDDLDDGEQDAADVSVPDTVPVDPAPAPWVVPDNQAEDGDTSWMDEETVSLDEPANLVLGKENEGTAPVGAAAPDHEDAPWGAEDTSRETAPLGDPMPWEMNESVDEVADPGDTVSWADESSNEVADSGETAPWEVDDGSSEAAGHGDAVPWETDDDSSEAADLGGAVPWETAKAASEAADLDVAAPWQAQEASDDLASFDTDEEEMALEATNEPVLNLAEAEADELDDDDLEELAEEEAPIDARSLGSSWDEFQPDPAPDMAAEMDTAPVVTHGHGQELELEEEGLEELDEDELEVIEEEADTQPVEQRSEKLAAAAVRLVAMPPIDLASSDESPMFADKDPAEPAPVAFATGDDGGGDDTVSFDDFSPLETEETEAASAAEEWASDDPLEVPVQPIEADTREVGDQPETLPGPPVFAGAAPLDDLEFEADASAADDVLDEALDSEEPLAVAFEAENAADPAMEEPLLEDLAEEEPLPAGENHSPEEPAAMVVEDELPDPEPVAAPDSPAEEEASAAEESADSSVPPLSQAQMDRLTEAIAAKVVEKLGRDTVRDIAWEIIPELAEAMVRKRIFELERAVDQE